MKRRLPHLLTAVSLLLYVAAGVLFVRGLLFEKGHAGHRRGSAAPDAVLYLTPASVHIRVAPGNEFSAPLWALALLLGVTPPLFRDLGAQRRRRLERAGLCPGCGYDLRATPGRCPECGTPAAGAGA
jgi:hypothetical protein